MVIRGLVCDIDDTLYLERDYVRSGFNHVAQVVGANADEVRRFGDWLWQAFESGVRDDTFDRFLDAFPELVERTSTAALVDDYRTHTPQIALAPGWTEVLDRLGDRGIRLGILSDGPIDSQTAKATALELDRWFDPIVLTGALEPRFAKPSTAGFTAIASNWGIGPAELAYVADNPEKDFAGPRQLGWLTIRLRHRAQLRHRLEPTSDGFQAAIEIRRPADLLGHVMPRP